MKAISLGLFSSIIFSIVLAKSSSDSGSPTGCFGFRRKKAKKRHKTELGSVKAKDKEEFDPDIPNIKFIDEFTPITLEDSKGCLSILDELFVSETDGTITDKVTGSLRREKDSSVSGWYIRPYEEDYEDMIMVNSIPLREYYQHEHQNVDKMPEKQEFSVEKKLSTIKDDDESTIYEDDASTILGDYDIMLNVFEEIDTEVVSSFEDGENDGEGEENQGECEKNQGESEKNQGDGEKNQGEGEKNQGESEKNQGESEKNQGDGEKNQGEGEKNQGESEKNGNEDNHEE
ncbi:erythrocyte membrane antigen 1 [Plasmodium chabaudi chabaudi]|uniref:Erythrocyte membrane antigen 1 n=1 Tax=Plasmodium chabaudi chabaudi TaxID=31271 RepID=A0A1D3L9Q6_PLACU|nr:erythrocyte membrane antigen 1 [Plasmodium chabaudi chabaudi]